MGREAEARTILSALKEEERTEEKAADALCDLDYRIVGEKKEEDLEYDVLRRYILIPADTKPVGRLSAASGKNR